jgi:hypothetical protein
MLERVSLKMAFGGQLKADLLREAAVFNMMRIMLKNL